MQGLQGGGYVVEEKEQGAGDVVLNKTLLVERWVDFVDMAPFTADKRNGSAPACSGKQASNKFRRRVSRVCADLKGFCRSSCHADLSFLTLEMKWPYEHEKCMAGLGELKCF